MARVSVQPEQFHFVRFDGGRIGELVQQVATALGADDLEIIVDIDEKVPLGRVDLLSVDPIHLHIQGAAFEDAKHPRDLSEREVLDVSGRWIVRALDRRSPDFATAPAEDALDVAVAVAWTASCAGRCEQAGFAPSKERWQYHFRNRHGFTDAADAIFERLWNDPSPTWASIESSSAEAIALRDGVPEAS